MRPSRPSIPPSRRERRRSREPEPPPVSPTRDRTRRLFAGSLTLLAGAGLGWLASDVVDDDRFREMAQIAEAVTSGVGAMPAYGEQLSEAQIQQIAAYVRKVVTAGR